MNILFLSGMFHDNQEKRIIENSKSVIHYAANEFQKKLVSGLNQIDQVKVEVLSAPFVGAYPKGYRKIRFECESKEDKCEYVSFLNVWGVRNISRAKNLKRKIRDFANLRVKEKVILVYCPHTPFLEAAKYAKKIDTSIKICLIVPDLPEFMNPGMRINPVYSLLKRLDIIYYQQLRKSVDSYVLLTEQMKDRMKISSHPYVVIEGIYDGRAKMGSGKLSLEKNFTYTGSLHYKFGVANLVKAFMQIERTDIRLTICGAGEAHNFIKQCARRDWRISYLGQVSIEESKSIQEQAAYLVNPRQNNEEFTKYSFPSKNIEYLATGRPVIAYKLDGIPDEYDSMFYYVSGNSVADLRKRMIEVMDLSEDEISERGKYNIEYLKAYKNPKAAAAKIVNMLYKISKGF